MPSFAVEGGLWLTLSRGVWDLALLSCLGTLAFWAAVAPRALAGAEKGVARTVDGLLRRLGWASLLSAAAALLVWMGLQSAEIAGVPDPSAMWDVALDTNFGHLVLLQLAALAATAAVLGRGDTATRRWGAAGAAALAAALQAGHGHLAAAEDGFDLLLAASILHVWTAGVWLGGLLPLWLVVRFAPARTAAAAARWFSPVGKWCVALLAGSACVQAWQLVGGLPGLVGTAYGWTACGKIVLYAVLLGFAWVNRYRLAPRLRTPDLAGARAALVWSIGVQTGFGVLVVLAASTLTSLPPAAHEQPTWPFPLRPSLLALADADYRREAMQGGLELLAGLVLVLAGAASWKRRRLALAAVAGGLLVGSASASHLDLLFVEAYPTSFYRSPTGFAATGISQGAALFGHNCASCHGADGRGDGPAAQGLPVPPADLTAEHLWAHDDGELFWWLTHGIDGPEGGLAMPGFAAALSENDRWALIDYIRARNAGASLHDMGAWPMPVQAPSFQISCPGGQTRSTRELRGTVLFLVAGPSAALAVPDRNSIPVVTVLMTQGRLPDSPAGCATADPAVWNAFAVLAGVSPAHLAGAQFLVDEHGWLRAAQLAGRPGSLLADLEAIGNHPLAAPAGGHVHH